MLTPPTGMDDGTISGIITLPSYDGRFHLSTKYHSATGLANIKGETSVEHWQESLTTSQVISSRWPRSERPSGRYSPSSCWRNWVVCGHCVSVVPSTWWSVHCHNEMHLSLIQQGSIIQITASSSLGQIYVGRLLLGVAYGVSGVACPTYLAEIAPKAIRGACGICCEHTFQRYGDLLTNADGGSYYIGLIVGYFASQSGTRPLP